MASVAVTQEGITLRFGDADTPAPEGVVAASPPPRIVIAASPIDARMRISVHLRSRGQERSIALRSEHRTRDEQFFEGSFPNLRGGDRVEYSVLAELPRGEETIRLDSSETPGGIRRFEIAGEASRSRSPETKPRMAQPAGVVSESTGSTVTEPLRLSDAVRESGSAGSRGAAVTAGGGGMTLGAGGAASSPSPGGRGTLGEGGTELPSGGSGPSDGGSSNRVVEGRIFFDHGSPAEGVALRVYSRGFGGTRTLLSEGRTSQQGEYTISYAARGPSNVEVYAIGADGREVQLSQTKFASQAKEQLDLIVPGALQPGTAEFDRLTAAITPITGRAESIKDAVERGPRHDLSLVAGDTQWDTVVLALASEAFTLAGPTKIPADGLYAMARAGLPMDIRILANLSRQTVANAVRRAAEAGIVGAGSVDKTVQAFSEFAADYRFNNRIKGAVSSPKDFVGRARVSDADRTAFARAVREESLENIWTRARASGVSASGIQKLQLQGKLAYLTFNNADLVGHLERIVSSDPRELIKLGFYDDARWTQALQELAGSDSDRYAALIPDVFSGQTVEERVAAYTKELARRVRQMDPHAVTVDRIVTGKMAGVTDRTDVGMFLANAAAQGFRLGKDPLSRFVAEHENVVWNGVASEKQDAVLNEVRMLSSMYAISPSDEAMNTLLAAGFRSATEIAQYSYGAFLQRLQPFIPPQVEIPYKIVTERIFWKAQQQAATVFNVFDGLKRLNSPPYAPGASPEDVETGNRRIVEVRKKLTGLFPTLETLFGSVDYCECEHCRSVLSPAAYLVDLLRFLDPKNEAWETVKAAYRARTGSDYAKQKPFDVLDSRRPDIKNIALTCENTNTALPYIDVVNEILEQLMMTDQTPPAIEAYDVGESSSEDLIAEPQNILWSAYVGTSAKPGLRDLVYPITLPFNLPLEMVRTFLKQLGLPLWQLRERLLRPTGLASSGPGHTDGWTDLWFERLELAPEDVSALTRADRWYALFGYASASEALKMETDGAGASPAEGSLRNAKTLARRLDITYKELLELVRTRFINPEIENLIILKQLGVDPDTIDRYFGEGEALSPAQRTEFEATLGRQNLQAGDLRALRTQAIRRATVVLRSPSQGCDFATTTLGFDLDRPDADEAMAMVLLKMNALVRLQKKLGWEIHDLDRAITALMPGVATITMDNWPQAMRTALIYLAHVEDLHERFGDRLTREEILVFWSDIPTQGVSCLYDRLFLSSAVLGREKAFQKHLGRVFEGTVQLADHVDGVQQALQVSRDDIEPILHAAGATDRLLSIRNLSILMRYAVLAKGLDLPIADLLAMLSLSRRKPLLPLGGTLLTDIAQDVPWTDTLAFLREVGLVAEAGIDVAFVERICRHRGVAEEPAADADPVLLAVLALPPADPAAPDRWGATLVQTIAAQFSMPETIIRVLLGRIMVDSEGRPLMEGGFVDRARAISSLRRLRKSLDLVQSLGVTHAELEYLSRESAALDPNDLPIEEVLDQERAQNLKKGLLVWLEFVAARRQFGRSERLLAVLAAARQPVDAANTSASRAQALHESLAALTGRKPEWLATALDAIGVKAAGGATYEVAALADPSLLRQTCEAIKCFVRLGLNPKDIVEFAGTGVDEAVARKVRSSLKARYSPPAWRRLVKPIYDSLRKKQRDALVAHLCHVVDDGRPKYGDTAEKLFEYLLLDPGMEPAVIASRIQLAIASVQLFVQRCLMSLECERVDPEIIDRQRWQWMQRYRVWEANRKIYLWPENLLDPEFRDDKTHLFRTLEGKLLEGDVNDDLVRGALHDYLKGLEAVARLEMLTMYFEPGISADGAIIHVVGRTPSAPHKYFYRRISHGMWTPWEPIEIGIEGAHLVLTAWRGRIYLFWLSFLEQAAENPNPPSTIKPSTDEISLGSLKGTTRVKLQAHWAEHVRGRWVNRSSTPDFLDAGDFAGLHATTDEDKKGFFVRAVLVENAAGAQDDDLEIHVTSVYAKKTHKFVFFSTLALPRLESTSEYPPAPRVGPQSPRKTKWEGRGGLWAEFVSAVTQSSQTGTPEYEGGVHEVLGGGEEYALLFPSNESLPAPARTPPSGVGRPTGFVFRPQNAQHVAYRSSDGSVHDLFWTRNGWFYQSPSLDAETSDPLAECEPASNDPFGYVLDDRGTICIAYAGKTKVHELVWSQLDPSLDDSENLGTGWYVETLYAAPTIAEQPAGRPLGGMFLPQRGVIFRTSDGRLLAAVEGPAGAAWDVKDLNASHPRAATDPAGLLMTKTELGVTTVVSRHVFYRGTDGNVHELQSDAGGGAWTYRNITQSLAGVVKPADGATVAAYAFLGQNTLHVVYRGTDNRIHELWGPPGSWNYSPVGAGFAKAKGDPAGYVTESYWTQHIVYRGENDQVVELWWDGAWHEHEITRTVATSPPAKSDVAGYSFESQRTQHVVYFSEDGRPRELWWSPNDWHAGDYSLANPFPDDLGPLASPFFYEAMKKDHTFFVEPYVVETTVHEWTEWIVTTREWVQETVHLPPLVALNPEATPFIPSQFSIIQKAERFTKKLFEDKAVVLTSKGAVCPGPDVRRADSDSGRPVVAKMQPKRVNVMRGWQSMSANATMELNRGDLR